MQKAKRKLTSDNPKIQNDGYLLGGVGRAWGQGGTFKDVGGILYFRLGSADVLFVHLWTYTSYK